MNQARSISPAALSALTALFSKLGGDDVTIQMIPVPIDPDSDVSVEDQFAAAIKDDLEKTIAESAADTADLAAHITGCSHCRKDYDKEIGSVANDQLQPYQIAIKAAVEKARAMRKAKRAQDDADKAAAVLRDIAGAGAAKQARKPLGYMAFCNGQPVPPSFSKDRAEVEAKVKEFQSTPAIAALDVLARAITGNVVGAGEIIVKPVYGE